MESQTAGAGSKSWEPRATYSEMTSSLEVDGVGTGTQTATLRVRHPIATNGAEGTFEAPALLNSTTPALLGQKSLRRSRAPLGCYNNKVYRVGPGGYTTAVTRIRMLASCGVARRSLDVAVQRVP